MQTYLVHTREPRRLHAELGWRGAVGFHALMGGLILSALVHPFFYALLAYFLITGELFLPAERSVGAAFLGDRLDQSRRGLRDFHPDRHDQRLPPPPLPAHPLVRC